MSRLPNASALISLHEAADYAGYRSVSTLRKAARATCGWCGPVHVSF